MSVASKPALEPKTGEFVVERVFEAPRKLVWQAWTEPERLAQWWGPKGCTIRVVKHDLREGGIFHYAMSFKPGHDMWGRFIYREIARARAIGVRQLFLGPPRRNNACALPAAWRRLAARDSE